MIPLAALQYSSHFISNVSIALLLMFLTDVEHIADTLRKHSLKKSERFFASGGQDGFFKALKHCQKANFFLSALEIIADNVVVICR